MLCTSMQAHRIGLALQFSYSLPFKMAAHTCIMEVSKNIQKLPINDVTCTLSVDTLHLFLLQGGSWGHCWRLSASGILVGLYTHR